VFINLVFNIFSAIIAYNNLIMKEAEIFNEDLPVSIIFTNWLTEALHIKNFNSMVAERANAYIEDIGNKTINELLLIFTDRYKKIKYGQ